jgi:hypothetical protein
MSDGNRSKLNHRLRKIIDIKIHQYVPGQKFKTDTIVQELITHDRRPRIEIHQVANLLRERNDVRWISSGVWEKVPA